VSGGNSRHHEICLLRVVRTFVLTDAAVLYRHSLGGDGHAQGDVCRGSNGVEFFKCGDELAEVTRDETVGGSNILYCEDSKNSFI
jgi:hypothetical protein